MKKIVIISASLLIGLTSAFAQSEKPAEKKPVDKPIRQQKIQSKKQHQSLNRLKATFHFHSSEY